LDAYQILGLNAGATKAQIKAAYRKLANKYHPDRNPAPAAEELFKLVKEAYEFLSKKRSDSGRFGQVAEPPKQPQPPPSPVHVQQVDLWLTFNEAFSGCRAKVRISGLGVQFFVNVHAGVQNNQVERLLAFNNYGQTVWVDCRYLLHDPKGFYEIRTIRNEEALYCRVQMSAADLISEREISIPNIDPTGGAIHVTIPCTDDYNHAVRVSGYGMRKQNMRRGPLYVEPIVFFRPLDQEPYPTLSKLKERVDKLTNAYKYFK